MRGLCDASITSDPASTKVNYISSVRFIVNLTEMSAPMHVNCYGYKGRLFKVAMNYYPTELSILPMSFITSMWLSMKSFSMILSVILVEVAGACEVAVVELHLQRVCLPVRSTNLY